MLAPAAAGSAFELGVAIHWSVFVLSFIGLFLLLFLLLLFIKPPLVAELPPPP